MGLIIPTCPICKLQMKLRKTMKGLRFICDNYHKCGESSSYEEWKNA